MVQEEEDTSNTGLKLFNYFSEDDKKFLASKVSCKIVAAGERFITQGDVQQTAYIIQRGACLLIVEKGGQLHPVGHLGRGDIIGIRSFLTGEPQSAHAEAETTMELWALDKNLFDNISKEDPELLEFLTELVASRFDSRRPTADRVIGKYMATDIIGRGGYSIVYRGLNTDLSMPVAIKMMKHDMAGRNLFKSVEMWILRKLREKNWAAGLLSNFQRRRLSQHIQRYIAGMVMSKSVVEMLADFEEEDAAAASAIFSVLMVKS